MRHLYHDHDIVFRLHDLVHIVVENIIHRRPTGATESDYATLTKSPALRAIVARKFCTVFLAQFTALL